MIKRPSTPASSPAGARAKAERQARLARALRLNLQKRKAQKRGRDEAARAVQSGIEDSEALEGGAKVK
jgi:hypothetical protein